MDSHFETYLELLQKWQKKINLVSNKTIDQAWERHFKDSLQLVDYIPPETKTLFDLGSGAGFPGLVIALVNPNLDVHLVESDQKKCAFLKTVSRETFVTVSIHNCRIEDVSHETIPDVITARALASLEKLFDYCESWINQNKGITLIFPKGENADREVEELSKKWQFKLKSYPSRTEPNAKILVFTDIYRV